MSGYVRAGASTASRATVRMARRARRRSHRRPTRRCGRPSGSHATEFERDEHALRIIGPERRRRGDRRTNRCSSGVKEIPYDYVATFKLTGTRGTRAQDVIHVTTEGTFVAVSVGSSFLPAAKTLTPTTAPPPSTRPSRRCFPARRPVSEPTMPSPHWPKASSCDSAGCTFSTPLSTPAAGGVAKQVRAQHRRAWRGRRRSAVLLLPVRCRSCRARRFASRSRKCRRVPSSRTARSSSCCTATRGWANDRYRTRADVSRLRDSGGCQLFRRLEHRDGSEQQQPRSRAAKYQLHPNYCGELQYLAQFTDAYALSPAAVETPDLEWQIRSDGQPLAGSLAFRRIINPWGLSGFPIHIRLRKARSPNWWCGLSVRMWCRCCRARCR